MNAEPRTAEVEYTVTLYLTGTVNLDADGYEDLTLAEAIEVNRRLLEDPSERYWAIGAWVTLVDTEVTAETKAARLARDVLHNLSGERVSHPNYPGEVLYIYRTWGAGWAEVRNMSHSITAKVHTDDLSILTDADYETGTAP